MAVVANDSDSLDLLVAQFNPRDYGFRSDPYPIYHALRRRAPICPRPQRNDWILTRYDDVVALAKDTRLCGMHREDPSAFLEGAPTGGATTGFSRFLYFRRESQALRALWLTNRNGADHSRLRKLLLQLFSRSRVAKLRERIEAKVCAYLDRVQDQDGMDIIEDLSRPLAFDLIADLLGIPDEFRGALAQVEADQATQRIDLDPTAVAFESGLMGMVGMTKEFRRVIAHWPDRPSSQESLIGVLLQAHEEGLVSREEVLAQCGLALVAGHSTTQHLIGNGVLALLRHPDQLRLLRAQPDRIEAAVEELMRFDTPAQVLERSATTDVEIGDHTIRKGQVVHLVLGAANRDPAVFSEPDRLDITRDPNPHLSFGHGTHHCLGSSLSRLSAQIAIDALLRRRPRLSLKNDTVEWRDNYLMHGIKSLPVLFE